MIAWDATDMLEAERERFSRVRSGVVRVLQQALLPSSLPEIPGAELGASYVAAEESVEVGGDFYDVFAIENDGWALTIGDVTGKGAKAASFARHTVRAAAMRVKHPKRVPSALNKEILRQTDGDRLLTVVHGELEPDGGGGGAMKLGIACAGHPSPVILHRDGTVERFSATGVILGAAAEPEICYSEAVLSRGEAVVLYTDGVTEARNPSGKFFGEARLMRLVSQCAGLAADQIAGRIEDEVRDFQGTRIRDDVAVLVLRIPE